MASGSSGEPNQGSPSFFKVVRYPSAPHLSLPNAFVGRYLEKIPKNPILKTETGEHSWRLKIKKIGEDYCFTHGWNELVKDTQLCIRDIIVFWLIDPLTFQVSFFDAHGCEKDLPLSNTSGDDEVMPDENLCFQKVISQKTHKYDMALPKKFVKAAGLENEKSIRMKDAEGKEWRIGLLAEMYQTTKYSLSSGWSRFKGYHKLSDGDICLFKFMKEEGVMILAQVLRSEKPMNQETPTVEGEKRKRGRPPLEKPRAAAAAVKIEDVACPPLLQSAKVKIEDESGAKEVAVKRKRGRPPLKKPASGGGVVQVKIEAETEVEKTTTGRPPLEKPAAVGVVEVKTEADAEAEVAVVKRKRGRPRKERTETEAERLARNRQVIYF